MFDQSIIKKTGQLWKMVVAFIVILSAGLFLHYGYSHYSFPQILIGMVLAIVAFVFPCVSVKCPVCGAKWVWRAIKGQGSNQWLFWLFSHSVCPVCQGDEVLKIITAPDNKRRVVFYRRHNKIYGFEEEWYSDDPLEKCWCLSKANSFSMCDSFETALNEAKARIDWLGKLNG